MSRYKGQISQEQMEAMAGAFCRIKDVRAMGRFFDEIFTPAERRDFALRWELMRLLREGVSQREIASRLGISLCKITRGAKIIKDPDSVTNHIMNTQSQLGDENGPKDTVE